MILRFTVLAIFLMNLHWFLMNWDIISFVNVIFFLIILTGFNDGE